MSLISTLTVVSGLTAQEFIRGTLHPTMAKELYGSTSEVLADQAAKSLVWVSSSIPLFGASLFTWVLMLILVQGQHYSMALIDRVLDAGQVIERQLDAYATLHLENQDLMNWFDLEVVAVIEQRASALDEEVSHLKAELEESRSHAQMLEDEL